MHRTQLFIPEDLHATLKEEAKENKTTISEYVRLIIDEHMLRHHRTRAEKGIITLLKLAEGKKQ